MNKRAIRAGIILGLIFMLLFGSISLAEDVYVTNDVLDVEVVNDEIHVIVDNADVIADAVVKAFLEKEYVAKVTEVYSINNTLENCYYKPKAADIPYLEESVLAHGFINAYTGYFDLDWSSEYIPENHSSRAVEVLGSDSLIQSEAYADGNYSAVEIPEMNIGSNVAIMSIYKALDLPQYEITYYVSPVTRTHIRQSPAILNLPSFIKDVDPTYGRMRVFVTRSNVDLYVDKAQRDMKLADDVTSSMTLTAGEFIVLLRNMMDFYGEPRMSETETNAVLQIYGGNIPTYLTSDQKDAYIYLKARGIINDDTIDYSSALTLTQMLEMLMCVKDEDSRTDFKQIQLTMDVSDALESKGYFPKTVAVSDNSDALEFETEFDYANATKYDYYVVKDSNTTFVSASGEELTTMFIPSTPADPSSVGVSGFQYLGVENGEDGTEYFHYQIAIMDDSSNYMKVSSNVVGESGWIQINTLQNSDKPAYIWLKQGGGIYTYQSTDSENGVTLNRRAFEDGEFEEAASAERKEGSLSAKLESRTLLAKVVDTISGWFNAGEMSVKAATTNSNVNVKVRVYRAETISEESLQKLMTLPWIVDPTSTASGTVDATTTTGATSIANSENCNNIKAIMTGRLTNDNMILEVTIPQSKYSLFLSYLEKDQSNVRNVGYEGIANMNGDVLLNYQTLVDRGVLVPNSDGSLPQPASGDDNEILVLDSKIGRIVLNNSLHQLVVGTTIYHINNDKHQLFEYVLAANSDSGEDELWVDFRAAYGWSSNIINIEVTGDASGYTVNIEEPSNSVTYASQIMQLPVQLPDAFTSGDSDNFVLAVDSEIVASSNDCDSVLMTSGYPLSNWVIWQGQNGDYLFIYYIKDAFTSMGLDPPNDLSTLESIVGYSTISNDWCVRVVELTKYLSDEPGKFSYVEPFGYLYNLPKAANFTLEKYLNGNYLLPLAEATWQGSYDFDADTTSRKVINYNVNYFKGLPYGYRPLSNSKSLSRAVGYMDDVIDVETDVAYTSIDCIVAAPAGVQSMFGGYKRTVVSVGSTGESAVILSLKDSLKQNTATVNRIYLGTSPLSSIAKGSGSTGSNNATVVALSMGSTSTCTIRMQLNDGTKMYQVSKLSFNNTEYYRYVVFDSVLQSEVLGSGLSSTADEKAIVEIVDGERTDEYVDSDGFALKYILNKIDSTTSFFIVFCLQILPLLGIILLTLVFGFVCMADNKLVQTIFKRSIDPIKVLTLGKLNVDLVDKKRAFLGLIIGYCMFAMVLDGNIIRIIIWFSEMFDSFATLIRQTNLSVFG